MYWDPQAVLFSIPWIDLPILWYGFFFALAFWIGALLLSPLLQRLLPPAPRIKNRVQKIIDRLSLYIVIATIIGARLGHLLFYEPLAKTLHDPLDILRIRQGGLASHGAVVATVLALFLFSKRIRKEEPTLSFLHLLDVLSVVAPLTAACIRIGNFINQEILGRPTRLPWAITFGHPADGSAPIPRHPVQLYEAVAYLALFLFMWRLAKNLRSLAAGTLAGLLLTLLFSIRFLLEYCKQEQSTSFSSHYCTMGQLLSLPCIAVGLLLIFYSRKLCTKSTV